MQKVNKCGKNPIKDTKIDVKRQSILTVMKSHLDRVCTGCFDCEIEDDELFWRYRSRLDYSCRLYLVLRVRVLGQIDEILRYAFTGYGRIV